MNYLPIEVPGDVKPLQSSYMPAVYGDFPFHALFLRNAQEVAKLYVLSVKNKFDNDDVDINHALG